MDKIAQRFKKNKNKNVYKYIVTLKQTFYILEIQKFINK